MTGARGLTMVEMLVAVSLLALAAALGVVHLASASARARVQQALAVLESGDITARSMAGVSGPLVLTLAPDGSHVLLTHERSGATAWTRRVPTGVSARILPLGRSLGPGTQPQRVRFDTLGRCDDYLRLVASDDGAEVRLQVSGLTGWSEVAGTEGEP